MMLAIEERLFDEYKKVDKFCRDMFSSQSGVTQYITEMERIASYGRSVIPSWNDDYYTLKRVRWLRNKIAHESGATECNENDAAWLENFYRRLLARQDPLALLSNANRDRLIYSNRRGIKSNPYSDQWMYRNVDLQEKKDSSNRTVAALIVLVGVFIILAAVTALIMFC